MLRQVHHLKDANIKENNAIKIDKNAFLFIGTLGRESSRVELNSI